MMTENDFYLCFSIKIHDLSDLREMYAIINLDDENKGMLIVPMRIEIFANYLKKNFDGDSVYMSESTVVGKTV